MTSTPRRPRSAAARFITPLQSGGVRQVHRERDRADAVRGHLGSYLREVLPIAAQQRDISTGVGHPDRYGAAEPAGRPGNE